MLHDIFQDPKFWLAISFTIFTILMLKYVLPIILKSIDGKVSQITKNLADAEKMRKQAEKLLKSAQDYHKESVKYSDQLIKDSKVEADKITKDYKAEVKKDIEKKVAAADERIKAQEERVVREIKSKIVESAVNAIQSNVKDVANDKILNEVAKNSINQIGSKLIN
jgi:F-type H+-transporting ATPase subunit b